jgi:short-chain fatty acids transporter
MADQLGIREIALRDSYLDHFSKVMARFVPDAISACVFMMVALTLAAVAIGNTAAKIVEAYYQGLWMLLSFTMQMTLIIVLSACLGATPFFRALIRRLAALPRTPAQVTALCVLVSAGLAYLYWGLNVALGPIVAVYFAREAERRGIVVDFPFLFAATWAGGAAWQFGLSASAPLLVATPGHFLEKTIGIIPLSTTIWSPAAILHEVLFIGVVVVTACWLMPKARRQLSEFPGTAKLAETVEPPAAGALTGVERLERSTAVSLVLCFALGAWLWHHFFVRGASLDINSLNTTLLFSTLLLHGSFHRFTHALQAAVSSAWPVIVLYHLYAGIAGLIQHTGIGEQLAGAVAAISTPYTFPFFTAVIATVFAIFIPSSGGQWAIQGFVTVKAAESVGVSVQRGILAMSVGDHMGNLISPFWYVVIAGIAHVDFRSFFGYGLVFAAIWFVIGVAVFTFAPC